MRVGAGDFQYRIVEGWGMGPEGRVFGGVTPSAATDSQDRVYITRRSPPAILVYDRDGRYLTTWGEDVLHNPHSVWISREDHIYITDVDDHTVRTFTTDGQLLTTLGTPGQTGEPGMPFNEPTWAVLSENGNMWVSDGYGQHRVHHFSKDGRLIKSWGEEGEAPGQFTLPHGIRIDPRGRVMVLDRETNHRLQIFEMDGAFVEAWPVHGPCDIFIDQDEYVYIAGGNHGISVLTLDGELLAHWGEKGDKPGQFANGTHGLWIDSHGDLYVCEVPFLPDRVQKFERI